MKQVSAFRFLALGSLAFLLCACASGPELPPPAPGAGHVTVGMKLVEKTVSDVDVADEYAIRREKHVMGDTLPDMIVLLEGARGHTPPTSAEIALGKDGFSRRQLLLKRGGALKITNGRDVALTILGFSRNGHEIAAELGPGASATVNVPNAGAYELVTEADNGAYAVMHVTDCDCAWIGKSDEYAIFKDVAPGRYKAAVFQTRTPGWTKDFDLSADKRVDLTAEMKVAKRR
ncbi:MAG: hypothetical protein KF696_14825 [Planctomycetes bacterium]|nr:hypothetical protein [Planctomycetota bacterium]MCW8137108.1 hypothetical protein [Planctomycetota bacterium]